MVIDKVHPIIAPLDFSYLILVSPVGSWKIFEKIPIKVEWLYFFSFFVVLCDLFQPRTERQIGDCAFSVAAPRARNHIPTELKLMRSSTATFRRHLKSFLFHITY